MKFTQETYKYNLKYLKTAYSTAKFTDVSNNNEI